MPEVSTPSAWLGVQVGARRLLVALAEAGEVGPLPTAIAPVPMTHDWFLGLVNLRGSLYAVTDLACYAGEALTTVTKETGLIAFASNLGLNGAIVVARMLGLQRVNAMAATMPAETPSAPWLGAQWLDAEAQRWTELSLARLAGEDRFLSVARQSDC